jgi:hypothetical protein
MRIWSTFASSLLLITACAAATPAPQSHSAASAASAVPAASISPSPRSRAGEAPTGDVHDFDDFAGAWTTHQRRLKTRGMGSADWDEFPATLCVTQYLGGAANVSELYFPTKGWAGITVRTFDTDQHRWSVYWVSGKTGLLGAPQVGGFHGNRGEFVGTDDDGGRPILVRITWTKRDHDHMRWEQAFSYDHRSWETNWTADFLRADPADICDAGRPKR